MKSKKKKKGPSLKNKNKLKKNTNVKSKSLNKKKIKKTKTRKIRYGRIFMFIIMPIFLLYVAFSFIDFPIKNIFISGNSILSDQDIIEILSLEDYPSIFKYSSLSLERKLEDNMYIKEAKVTKKKLKEIAYLNKNLKIVFKDEHTGETMTFLEEYGIQSYVAYINRDATLLHKDVIYVEGTSGDI